MIKKTRMILSTAYLISLLPMLLSQFGGARGIQEIPGYISLINPIGILSLVLFLAGMLTLGQLNVSAKIMGLTGCIGMVISEIYEFLTWHIETITGKFSLGTSFQFAFPEFYFGLAVSVGMTLLYVYFIFIRKGDYSDHE